MIAGYKTGKAYQPTEEEHNRQVTGGAGKEPDQEVARPPGRRWQQRPRPRGWQQPQQQQQQPGNERQLGVQAG